jgi:uncharacterized protein GlcG (DUF336 family)
MTGAKDVTLALEGALKGLNAAIVGAAYGADDVIAVVDTGANLLAFGWMDGLKGLSATSSINKARTCLELPRRRKPTGFFSVHFGVAAHALTKPHRASRWPQNSM